jgi:hypothetical protein
MNHLQVLRNNIRLTTLVTTYSPNSLDHPCSGSFLLATRSLLGTSHSFKSAISISLVVDDTFTVDF